MGKKIRKHVKQIVPIEKPILKEDLRSQTRNVLLNVSLKDRISFSVLRNNRNKIRKIENISYEISIDGKWEWVVRYDDHGGSGSLHRHYRVDLTDTKIIESATGIKKYKNKDYELTWVCNDIKRNYMVFRERFLKNCGLDRYVHLNIRHLVLFQKLIRRHHV